LPKSVSTDDAEIDSSRAKSSRSDPSTCVSLCFAAKCNIVRYSLSANVLFRISKSSYAMRNTLDGNKSARYRYCANAPGLRTSQSMM